MDLQIRELSPPDIDKGLFSLLGQLTVVGDVDKNVASATVKELLELDQIYKVVVIEDLSCQKIVATAKLVIERKLTRNCGKCAHVEDVVVDKAYQGKKLGAKVLEALVDRAKEAGCYKIILDCSDTNVKFYEKCGFQRKEVQMAKYL